MYAGESVVKRENIDAAIETLRTMGLLTTKSTKERNERKPQAGETEATQDTGDTATEGPFALAVDLNAYKLGKPVVQKAG